MILHIGDIVNTCKYLAKNRERKCHIEDIRIIIKRIRIQEVCVDSNHIPES